MNSLILRSTTRVLIAALLLLSIFLLLRGHNLPGGGFIGGLVGASAVALYAIAFGLERTRDALRVPPQRLAAVGLAIAVVSGLFAALAGRPYLSGEWIFLPLGGDVVYVGTPLLFDIGVYLVVIGIVLTMIFTLEER